MWQAVEYYMGSVMAALLYQAPERRVTAAFFEANFDVRLRMIGAVIEMVDDDEINARWLTMRNKLKRKSKNRHKMAHRMAVFQARGVNAQGGLDLSPLLRDQRGFDNQRHATDLVTKDIQQNRDAFTALANEMDQFAEWIHLRLASLDTSP